MLVESNDGATVASWDTVNAAAMIQRATRTAGLAQNLSVVTMTPFGFRHRTPRVGIGDHRGRWVTRQRESEAGGCLRS